MFRLQFTTAARTPPYHTPTSTHPPTTHLRRGQEFEEWEAGEVGTGGEKKRGSLGPNIDIAYWDWRARGVWLSLGCDASATDQDTPEEPTGRRWGVRCPELCL